MKKDVVIVNTARGAVMDEDALVKALESGQVRSCGLDVFEEEPKIHPELIKNPRVMLLPHMGKSAKTLCCLIHLLILVPLRLQVRTVWKR